MWCLAATAPYGSKPGQAGSPHLVDGDQEVEAGQDGGKSGDEDPQRCQDDVAVGVSAAVGRVKCPAGIKTPEDERAQETQGYSSSVSARFSPA